MDSDNAGTRDPVEDVLTEFDRRKDTLEEFCVRTKSLIEDCLDCEGVHYQLVQARVKKREKLREKYLNPKKKYIGLDDITDQAALRVITYYENEVDRVADVIRREFTVIPQKSVDKREAEPDKFGYYGLNLVCTHSYKRIRDVQFKKYGDLEFEIQVISILKHAWAELQHDWYDLKDTYPDDIKRRFYRLAAILESAESEFSDLRKAKEAYRRVVDMLGKAAGSDISVNTISLKAFISREPIVAQLDAQIAAIRDSALDQHPPSDSVLKLMSDLTNTVGLATLVELCNSLRENEADVLACAKAWDQFPFGGTNRGVVLARGICIWDLAIMLVAVRGGESERKALELMKAEGYSLKDVKMQMRYAYLRAKDRE